MKLMQALRCLAILALVLVLSSCATSRNLADGKRIAPSKGVLVFKVESNQTWLQLQFKKFRAQETFGSSMAEAFIGPDEAIFVNQPEKYWVMPVTAGDYMWSKIVVVGREASFHSSNKFSVEAGAITYAGHIRIDSRGNMVRILATDEEADMRSFLERDYPQYMRTMAFKKHITDMSL